MTSKPARAEPQSIDNTALIIAVLAPAAGVIVALFARSAAHKRGERSSTRTVAALSIGVALCLVITGAAVAVVIAWFAATAAATSTLPAVGKELVAFTHTNEIVLIADYADLSTAELNVVAAVVAERLDRAGFAHDEISVKGAGVYVVFPDDATPDEVEQASAVATKTFSATFHPVLAANDSGTVPAPAAAIFDETVCSPAHTIEAVGDNYVACSRDASVKYVLGPIAIRGAQVDDAVAVQTATDLTLNTEATTALESVTTDLLEQQQQPENQLAIVLDGQVISASVVMSVLTDGHLQLVDGPNATPAPAQTLAVHFLLAAQLVTLVEAATTVHD
ncbi:SecDF P1 head subdomain-containing protein [Cryobacterium aureum]|uniref:SecDF P1 head subdomain-containing protein n=1 Tax=Cryobacterium aureum TaxID=995037 RepID=UPI000CF41EFF|nr:hypothetical protein [Cryobacterium aureum]